MSKKMMHSIMMIITYAVLLILVLLKIDLLWGLAEKLIGVMKPLFIGFAIAFVLNRPCSSLCSFYSRHFGKKYSRWNRPLAVASSYVLVLVVLFALFSFVLPQVADSIRLFVNGLGGYISNLQGWVNELVAYFDYSGVDLSGLDTYLHKILNGMLNTLTNAAGQVMTLTGNLMSMLVTLVLSIVFSVYMLSGRDTLLAQSRKLLHAYVPQPWADRVHSVLHLTADTFTNFVSGQLIEACILGGLCAVGMLFIQADYAPMVGVIVGTTALVPVAGAYIGAVLSAFLLLMVSPIRAVIFLIFLGILQQIEGNVIYPRVVGTSIGLPGIWVLTAVTVGGGLFGLLGILLSVPVASVLYTLLRRDVRRRTQDQEISTKKLES